jgi:hypothetical protein
MKAAPYLIGLLMAGILAYGLYLQFKHPRRVTGYGQVTAKSRHSPGKTVTLRTRDVEGSGTTFKEVELPNGTWIDCAADCAETVRREHLDIWETKREVGR